MQSNWHYPTEIFLSENEINNLAEHMRTLNICNPLVVVDKFILTLPSIKNIMRQTNIAAGNIFSNFQPNPTDVDIYNGSELVLKNNNDAVICIGGGSALDTGKTIALYAKQSCSLWVLKDKFDNYKYTDADKILPIIAVPTTAGTGSEAGRASAIIETKTRSKKLISHPKLLPSIVIADPCLHISLPTHLTAATGMDAFAHSLEAYCAPGFHPMADGIAISAMRLIKENLIIACTNPSDITARSSMLSASIMGAAAFQKGLGAIHSLSHPVGGLYDAHHGLLNAIFMLPVLEFNRAAIEEKITYLAHCLEIDKPSFDAFTTWLKNFLQTINIPLSLSAINIDNEKIETICQRAMHDPSTATNPVALTIDGFKTIFAAALKGQYATTASTK